MAQNTQTKKSIQSNIYTYGGEMGRLTSEFDWSQTPVGIPELWPQSLKTTVSMLLSSKFPMFLWWGPDKIQFYNDAYRPSLGNQGKHPLALGQKGIECWPEIWDTIHPLMEQVLTTGIATFSEDQLIPIWRNGKIEDVYWTFGYSPIWGDEDTVEGVLVVCNETTENVINVQKIKESKDQLHFAIEAAELGTWEYNPKTGRFITNDRLKDWFGIHGDLSLNFDMAMDVIAQKDRARVQETILSALKYTSGGNFDIVYSIIHPEQGHEKIVRAKGKAWFDETFTAYKFNGTVQDITPEVLSRQKLEESESKLRSLIYSAPAGIGLFRGKDLVIEMPNKTFIDIVGKGADIEGKPLREVMPELLTENQPYLKILEDVYTQGVMFKSYASLVKIFREGAMTSNYYNITYTPLLDADGNVYAILDIAIDVTEEILARHRLEESECRFRTMAEDSEILIALADETSNATYFSKAWVELTGRPMDALLQYGWLDLVHPEDRQQYLQIYLDAFEKKASFTGEFRIRNKHGAYRWLLAKGPARHHADGTFAGYISSCVDITDRKMSEKALIDKNAELVRINNDLDTFIYTASHDLKAPMSNIEGLLNTLKDELLIEIGDRPEITLVLQLMDKSIERFKTTILDLTEITKIQKSDDDDVYETNLTDLVDQIKLSIHSSIVTSGAEIKMDLTGFESLKFSRKNLRSLMYNLLSNAIKYASP
ncbi:MAG TPA: PAS domain S-box protein, partial [Cytophagales bacterium]|nr:PAS domain S-box protein [Cytophagales bacterium]